MDEVGYNFVKEVDWNNGLYLQAPGALKLEALMVIVKTIVMGAQADPELLEAKDDAYHKAIGSIDEAGYSFAKEADWNNGLHPQAPGVLKP